jgi:hypothetical protein
MFRVGTQVGDIGSDDLHPVAQTHGCYSACQRIHSGGTPVSKHHNQLGSLDCNHQARNSPARTNINHRMCRRGECINELAGVLNNFCNGAITKSPHTLGSQQHVFEGSAGLSHGSPRVVKRPGH